MATKIETENAYICENDQFCANPETFHSHAEFRKFVIRAFGADALYGVVARGDKLVDENGIIVLAPCVTDRSENQLK